MRRHTSSTGDQPSCSSLYQSVSRLNTMLSSLCFVLLLWFKAFHAAPPALPVALGRLARHAQP